MVCIWHANRRFMVSKAFLPLKGCSLSFRNSSEFCVFFLILVTTGPRNGIERMPRKFTFYLPRLSNLWISDPENHKSSSYCGDGKTAVLLLTWINLIPRKPAMFFVFYSYLYIFQPSDVKCTPLQHRQMSFTSWDMFASGEMHPHLIWIRNTSRLQLQSRHGFPLNVKRYI